jgi:hypothetical protein
MENNVNVKDYVLKEMRLIAYNGRDYDISALRGNLMIYEDIFGTPMTGELSVTDTMDLCTLFPFIGEEVLRVIFTKRNPEKPSEELDPIILEFDVYKVTGRTILQTKAQQYTFHLLSRESCNAYKNKVFKGWKHVKYSDMVKDVFNNYITDTTKPEQSRKKLIVEETSGEHNFCIGNKSPYELINLFAARSIPSGSTNGKGHMPPYLFFETKTDFRYVSLDSLLLQEHTETYVRRIANMRNPENYSKEVEKDIKRIEFIDWVGWYDTMRFLDMGFYGQELITVDSVLRKFNKYDFKINRDWDSFNKLEPERVISENSHLADSVMAHRKLISTNLGIESYNPEEHSLNLESYALSRTAKLAQMFYTRFAMSIPGDPRRNVGEVIKIELPEEAGDVDSNRPEKYNRYYYGNYLITSLKHHISFTAYTIDLEVARDGFWQKIEHEDPFERYKDTV